MSTRLARRCSALLQSHVPRHLTASPSPCALDAAATVTATAAAAAQPFSTCLRSFSGGAACAGPGSVTEQLHGKAAACMRQRMSMGSSPSMGTVASACGTPCNLRMTAEQQHVMSRGLAQQLQHRQYCHHATTQAVQLLTQQGTLSRAVSACQGQAQSPIAQGLAASVAKVSVLGQVRRHQTDAAARRREAKPPASAAELGLYWGAAAVAMVGFSYAMVPLYKIFCAATGYGGQLGGIETVESKLKRRQEKPNEKVEQAAAQREITVWFNADVAEDMPWEFTPTQEYVKVRPGQSTLVFFTARNKSDQPVTGYSVYNVTPDKAAIYFNKIQCFCFEEQRLRGSEEIDMPVFFYLDPEMATDWNCRNVSDITLSYMFHRVEDADWDEADQADDSPSVVKLHGPAPGSGMGLPPGIAAPVPTPAGA